MKKEKKLLSNKQIVYSSQNIETMVKAAASRKYPCEHPGCNMSFDEAREHKAHIAQHKWGPHEVRKNPHDGSTQFLCLHPGCKKVMNDRKLLRKHLLTHREKQFACHYDGCDKRFYERAKLKRHFLVHTQEKPFKCPVENCQKTFGYKANLKTHLRTHTGDKPCLHGRRMRSAICPSFQPQFACSNAPKKQSWMCYYTAGSTQTQSLAIPNGCGQASKDGTPSTFSSDDLLWPLQHVPNAIPYGWIKSGTDARGCDSNANFHQKPCETLFNSKADGNDTKFSWSGNDATARPWHRHPPTTPISSIWLYPIPVWGVGKSHVGERYFPRCSPNTMLAPCD